MLPFDQDVPMKSFAVYLILFAALKGNGYDIFPTQCNHFLKLIWHKYSNAILFPETYQVRRLFKTEAITEFPEDNIAFVKKNIDDGKYLHLDLFKRYILGPNFNGTFPFVIIGYDDQTETVAIAGFFFDPKKPRVNKYDVRHIKYDLFEKACPKSEKDISYSWNFCLLQRKIKIIEKIFGDRYFFFIPEDYRCNRYLFWLPENSMQEEFNFKKIRRDIFFYSHNIPPYPLNLCVYRRYRAMFVKQNKTHDGPFDLRYFEILKEHATILFELIRKFYPDSECQTKYANVLKKIQRMLLIGTKYNLSRKDKKKAMEKMSQLLLEVRSEEPKVLKDFYRAIKKYHLMEE
jgi:hypothetical protein